MVPGWCLQPPAQPVPLFHHPGREDKLRTGIQTISVELLWMPKSFGQLLAGSWVPSRTAVPRASIRCARECPAARPRHRSPPHLCSWPPYAGFWIPTWGSSMVPSVQPGTGLFPEPFGVSRRQLSCFTWKHQLQTHVGAGDRNFIKAKPRATQHPKGRI